MSIFTLNGKRINIQVRYTDPGTGEHGIDLTLPVNRARFNIVEVPEPAAPADYSDKLYYRNEQDDAPYVVYERKPQEQIDAATKAEAVAQIEAMERQQLLPRATREFMLTFMEASFTPEQLAANYGYRAVKEFDTTIAALRPKP